MQLFKILVLEFLNKRKDHIMFSSFNYQDFYVQLKECPVVLQIPVFKMRIQFYLL